MVRRIAAVMALVAFATCLVAGIGADNTFATAVSRALAAMAGTFVVGLVVGAMAQRMLDENLAARATPAKPDAESAGGAKEKTGKIPETKPGPRDR